MPVTIEREVKLRFDNVAQAHAALTNAGATPMRPRRLQEDCLLDTPDGSLRRRGSVLRIRLDSGQAILTFKGPTQPSLLKVREESETLVDDRLVLMRVFEAIGLRVWFRYQKYREEYALGPATVALDETPVGTFIEVEGPDRSVIDAVSALGRGPADYVLASYRELFVRHCTERGIPIGDMLFERP